MYDGTIHRSTLSRHLQPKDFVVDPQLLQPAYKNALLTRAMDYARLGFPAYSLSQSSLRGKNIYGYTDIAEAVVIRQITSNIRRITSVKQNSRSFIVDCLSSITAQGLRYRVYKFDISQFYESVEVDAILNRLRADIAFSGQSIRALTSFFDQLKLGGVDGLPRGLALSATLAEYLLRRFDEMIGNLGGVWFSARFVDDIIIVTDGREDATGFRNVVEAFLPNGLSFNAKSRTLDCGAFSKAIPPGLDATFDFLGYRFDVFKSQRTPEAGISRIVRLDLASSKVRKFKTRVVKSLEQYAADGLFVDLRDRLRMLTSNVVYVDFDSGVRRPSGIRFNYPRIDATQSTCLPELDRFLRMAITAPHPKNRFYPGALTSAQRSELAGLTFTGGVSSKRFFDIATTRLMSLAGVWSYV